MTQDAMNDALQNAIAADQRPHWVALAITAALLWVAVYAALTALQRWLERRARP